MSSEESFPTFVDVNPSHMAASSADQPVSITVLVDQSSTAITNDCESAENLQKQLVGSLQSPDDQEIEINEGEQSNVEDVTHVWVREEVELLFKLYKERQKDVNDPQKKKRDVWVEIACELRQHGYNPTPKQCDRKLRNMKATYIKTLERIKRGDHLSTCQYYDELYDLYGLTPPLQTPQRFIVQSRNRPVPGIKAEYVNSEINMDANSPTGSYEPPTKRIAIQNSNQNGISPKQQTTTDLISHLNTTVQVVERQQQSDVKAMNDLLEKIQSLQKALENEKEARETERKSFEEERREFHKERMAMLNSINKLIGNLDQTKS